MRSTNPRAIQSALRRLLGDSDRLRRGQSHIQRAQSDSPSAPSARAVRRELDSFRQGQAMPFWHHDRRSG
jgi:hypothetical protein